MVERQLCKLEVRGSNPLASKAESVEANIHNPAHFRMHKRERNPLVSIFAQRKCRAVVSQRETKGKSI